MDIPVAVSTGSAAPAETAPGAMDDPVAMSNDSAAPAETTPKTRRPQLASRVGKDGKPKVPWRAKGDPAQQPRIGPDLAAKYKKWGQKLARVKGAYPKQVAQQAWAENQPASIAKYRKVDHIDATTEAKRVEGKKKNSKSQVVKNMGKGRGRTGKKTRKAITRAYMHTHKNEALRVCKLLAKMRGYERYSAPVKMRTAATVIRIITAAMEEECARHGV